MVNDPVGPQEQHVKFMLDALLNAARHADMTITYLQGEISRLEAELAQERSRHKDEEGDRR